MRRRDARDLARLAQTALSALHEIPLVRLVDDADAQRLRWAREGVAVSGVVLGHLRAALATEAARQRHRRPDAEPEQPAPVVPPGELFEWADLGLGTVSATREGPLQAPHRAHLVTTSSGVSLDADGCRALGRWLLAVADDERRPS